MRSRFPRIRAFDAATQSDPVLYRTARSILRDDTEAEDVVQDAYLLAYRNIDKFRGDAKLSTWLTRIVINEAIARSRKNHRRAEVIRLDGEMEWNGDAAEVNMNDSAPEATVRTRFFRARSLLRESLPREIDFAFEEAFTFDAERCDRIVAGVLARLIN